MPPALRFFTLTRPDEVHAAGVEAVPAVALRAAAVALAIELRLLVDDVVLAGDVMHVELGLRDDLVGVVELGGLRQMRDVAGVDHERRLRRQRLDAADGLLQRALGVGIGGLVEAHVAVADLQEGEALALPRPSPGRPGRASAARRPTTVQSRPVPAQVMHSRTLRRVVPSPLQSSSEVMIRLPCSMSATGTGSGIAGDLFPANARTIKALRNQIFTLKPRRQPGHGR